MLALLVLTACARPDAEQQLRASFAAAQQGLVDRKTGDVMSHVSRDFVGKGGLDHDGVRRMLALQFLRHSDIGVRTGPLEVSLQGESARVRFTAFTTGGAGGLIPDTGQVYSVDSQWRREGGDWKLLSLEWEPQLGR